MGKQIENYFWDMLFLKFNPQIAAVVMPGLINKLRLSIQNDLSAKTRIYVSNFN